MDAALLEEVVPEIPVLSGLLITATLVGLHMTVSTDLQGMLVCLHQV